MIQAVLVLGIVFFFRFLISRATQTISDLIQCLLEVSPWIRSQIRTLKILPLANIFTSSNSLFKSSLISAVPVLSVRSHSLKNVIWEKVSIYFHDNNQSKNNPDQLRNKATMSHMCYMCLLLHSVLNTARHLLNIWLLNKLAQWGSHSVRTGWQKWRTIICKNSLLNKVLYSVE